MKKSAFFLIPLLAFLSFGCPGTNSSTDAINQTRLNVGETSLVFNEIGGSQLVAVSGDVDWTAASNQTWCTVSPDHGNGDDAISIVVEQNNTIVQRTAKVIVKTADNSLSQGILITQEAGQPTGPATDGHNSIDASPAVLDFLTPGGSKTLQISSNVAWQITSDQGWCGVSAPSGSGNYSVQVTVSANGSTSSRIARLNVTNSTYALTKTVVVTQLGVEPSIVILPPLIKNIGAGTETINVDVSTNVDFDVAPGVSWITVTQASSTAVTLQAQANPATASRTGTVTLKQKNGSVSAALTVIQEGRPPTVYYVSLGGNEISDGKSWNNAVKNISTAIYLATAGDQVWVEEGAYSGNVVMKDGVTVYGGFNRSENSIADRKTRESRLTGTVFTSTDNYTMPTIIDGFTIDGSNSIQQTLNKNSVIKNCELIVNVDMAGDKLRLSGGTISNSTISINTYNGLVMGSFISISSGGMILNCDILNNFGLSYSTYYSCYGIVLNGGRLEGCMISEIANSSLVRYSGNDNYIINCTFHDINSRVATTNFYEGSGSLNFVNNIVMPHNLNKGTTTGLYESSNLQGLVNDSVYYLNPDLSPMSQSPAVNKGTNSFVTLDKDILGNPRIQNGTVDIGAIESSF